MKCHLCDEKGVSRCYTCGQLFCAKHGTKNCATCDGGFQEVEQRVQKGSRRERRRGDAWWRPQEAEAFVPDSCYVCKRLARSTCQTCQQFFCPEHAGAEHLCKQCHQSGQIAFAAFGVLVLIVVGLALWGFIHAPPQIR